MKFSVLSGSPHRNDATDALLTPFLRELRSRGHEAEVFRLYERKIEDCTACCTCQRDWTGYGCIIQDDMPSVFASVLSADTIVLATPIRGWFCTPPVKAALYRLMHSMNKHLGPEAGPSLWSGKHLAALTACGQRAQQGAGPFRAGLIQYCRHAELIYDGLLAEPLSENHVYPPDQALENRIRAFACRLERNGRYLEPVLHIS